jgi:hypothetical protein
MDVPAMPAEISGADLNEVAAAAFAGAMAEAYSKKILNHVVDIDARSVL